MKFSKLSQAKALSALIDNISVASGLIAGFTMLVVAFCTTYEVICRRAFDSPTTWVFSLSLFAMVWFPLLAAPLVMKEEKQIKVDFLVSRFSERTRAMLNIINYVISLVFIVTLCYYGLEMCADAYNRGITSVGLLIYPQWLLYLVFPVTMTLLILQIFNQVYKEITKLKAIQLTERQGWQGSPIFILITYVAIISFDIFLLRSEPVAGVIFLALSLMLGGCPVAFALSCSGIAGLFLTFQGFGNLPMVPVIVESTLHNFILLAIPMFIMGGVILEKCGIGERAFDLASKWFSAIPGGLAVGTILSCAVISAIVGVSTPVVAAIGMTAIPALLHRGYTKGMAYGSVAGGALGVLIPPSAGLIVYGFLTNSSVGQLFAAAFIPAFMVVTLFAIYVVIYCLATGKYERVSVTWKEKLLSIKNASLVLSAPVLVLGGIYSGIFTPTEAAGVLVIYSIFIALIYKRLNRKILIIILKESAILGSLIMMIMIGGMILSNLVVRLQVANHLTEWIVTANIPHWQTLSAIIMLYLILGMFLDGLSITVLTVPVLFPLMPVLGIDVVVFGVALMMLLEAALLTPPVGLNLFMVKAITGDKLWPIVKGNFPFALLLLLGTIILFLFPGLALWLPNKIGL